MLKERQLDFDAVLVVVRPNVILEGRFQETPVEFFVDRDGPEGRLPPLVHEGQRGARAMMVRSEDDDGGWPTVLSQGRVTVSCDRTRIGVSRVGYDEPDDPPITAAHLGHAARTQRMRVALADLA
jgi:hypothetical protein